VRTTAAPRALVPTASSGGAELLQQELGGEVVADAPHPGDDLRERRRLDRSQRHVVVALLPDARAADRHSGTAQGVAEEQRGCGRGIARRAAVIAAAVDGERRQRWALVDVEPRLPARAGAARVEERLVAEDAARDAADARGPHLPRQRREVSAGERGVAVADQDEAPAPDRSVLLAAAEHVGLEAERRAEGDQRRVGDRELLVRGGHEREVPVLREQRLAGHEVDRDGAGARLRDVRHGKRTGQPLRKRRVACAGRSREHEGHEHDDRQAAAGHPQHCSDGRERRQAWV
jgi:hypothetical protein